MVASICHDFCSDDIVGPSCCLPDDGQTGNVKESSVAHADVDMFRDNEAIIRKYDSLVMFMGI